MSPFADLARARPAGVADVHRVNGGLWQARCVCKWHGRRRKHNETATADALEHVQHCGTCKLGRANMETCSCMSCQRNREVRARWGMPITSGSNRNPDDGSKECRDDPPAPDPNSEPT